MDGVPASYKGRFVSKDSFRAFIYAPDGRQKLVESWKEFERHMETGLWFATRTECEVSKEIVPEKPKRGRSKPLVVQEDSGVEVKDDDFLPKGK